MSRLITDNALAAITAWQEGRGQSHEFRIAVCEVIRNRMARRIFSDGTVPGTVLAALQFSGMNARDPSRIPSFKIDDTDPLVADCLAAWDESETSSFTSGATHYYSPKSLPPGTPSPYWAATMPRVAVIDGTFFFKQ